ncbi:MAG: hypothetical protein JNK93_18160 [Planctomycetia bacterium]|nr:hypothetical protein [Planctomycetia bacterium]
MQSPFEIFRTHQKIMMVVLVGLSMIGFVLLGAVPDPSNMPRGLVFIAVLAVIGGAAWIAGMPSGRSNEYGGWGLAIGALVAAGFMMFGDQPPLAVLADTGDLSVEQLQDLRTRREIANQFIVEAVRTTRAPNELDRLVQQYTFNYGGSIDEDAVTSEMLRREAARLGLQISEPAVTEYIRKVTDNKITGASFTDIRTRLHVSEPELYDIISDELQARTAAKFLYGIDPESPLGYSPLMPPEEYWDLYRRMHVRERVEVASLPVKEFIDEAVEPTPEQLAELFDKYKNSEPYLTPDGDFEEGRPGFKQPRRLQVGSVEAVFDDFKAGITPVTDADIEAYYQENYVKPAEEAAARAAEAAARRSQTGTPPAGGPGLPETLELDLPALPEQPAQPPTGDTPATETPASETPATEPPATEAPASEAPATETPAADTPAAEPAADQPATEGGATPEANPAPTETPAETPATPAATEPKPGETSFNESTSDTGLFSVADGEPAAEQPAAAEPAAAEAATEPAAAEPAAEAPAVEAPATDPATPAAEPAAEPAADTAEPSATTPPEAATPPEATTPPEGTTPPEATTPPEGSTPPAGTVPPSPQPNIPLLDDALRATIRSNIEAERTAVLLRKAVEDAANYIEEEVGFHIHVTDDNAPKMTPARAAELLKEYAAKNNLHYSESPLLSYQEMLADEDNPVGASVVADDPNSRPLPNAVFQTGPRDTFRPIVTENRVTQSWFASWKVGEQPPYEPQSLDDERVRAQVVKTWRELQAREKAKARAEALAEQARASDQSLSVALGETTITGNENGLFLTVTETPEFSWLSSPSAMQSNPFFPEPPRIQDPPGVEGVLNDFMKVVFDDLKPGEIGVASNMERNTYYVVKVTTRSPAPGDVQYETFRERFMREPVFQDDPFFAQFGIERPSVYSMLAVRQTLEREPNWARGRQGLWTRHGVTLVGPAAPQEQ